MHPFPQHAANPSGKPAAALPADSWRVLALMLGALLLAVALTAMAGLWRGADQRLEELSFGLFDRPASGQIHIVEMDAASMATIQRWPWPREHYARAVTALDAAGVRSISFDVDLSSAGDPAGDRALAKAIAAARAPVALATFAQQAGTGDERKLDSLPIPILREPAHLASVSVAPDTDRNSPSKATQSPTPEAAEVGGAAPQPASASAARPRTTRRLSPAATPAPGPPAGADGYGTPSAPPRRCS